MMKSIKFFLILFCMVFPLSMISGTVYMKKEADGSISFSDVPSSGSEKIKVKSPTVVKTPNGAGKPDEKAGPEVPNNLVPPANGEKPDSEPRQKKPMGTELTQKLVYQSVEITSPVSQATIWNPATLPVNVSVRYGDNKTGLQKGDRLVLLLDGQKVGEPTTSMSFTLNRAQVPRGEHSLRASVINENNTVLISSKTTTIFIHYKSVGS